jgi:hypothetical protein
MYCFDAAHRTAIEWVRCHTSFGDWVNRRYLKAKRESERRAGILGRLLQLVVYFGKSIDGEVEIFPRMSG